MTAASPLGGSGWRDRAACRGMNPNLFFVSYPGDRCVVARRKCAECPVRQECLEAALREPSDRLGGGIRGGMDADQRAKLRSRLAPELVECRECGETIQAREPGKGGTRRVFCSGACSTRWHYRKRVG